MSSRDSALRGESAAQSMMAHQKLKIPGKVGCRYAYGPRGGHGLAAQGIPEVGDEADPGHA